jgi:hypothetical protein
VSRSIMEYLGRGFRYLDQIGEYDTMAIAYGYKGILPQHFDWYCTDEDVANINIRSKSAECSSHDATNDPFQYFVNRLDRGLSLMINRGHSQAPVWTVDDVADQLEIALTGLGSYAVSAEETGSTWVKFFDKPGRPERYSEVKGYVLAQIKGVLCDSEIDSELDQKESDDAKEKTHQNLNYLKEKVVKVLSPVYSRKDLQCREVWN